MTKQTVFVVGPNDHKLNLMWMSHPEYKLTSYIQSADIVCFQGGADVHPKLYNQKLLPGTFPSESRDKEDLDAWELSHNKKRVGICRGGQFLNVMSEGEMFQHVDGHMSSHQVTNILDIPGSVFQQGMELDVTSDHHQMMIANEHYGEIIAIADKATIFRTADTTRAVPDFDTEVVWYNHTDSLCFQPHPEYDSKIICRTYFFKLMEFFFQ